MILTPQLEARILVGKGYRRVSNKFRHVARIDRPDWKEAMAKRHAPWDPEGEGMEWVEFLGETEAEDFYRRCHSKDVITVSTEVFFKIPGSLYSTTGYIILTKNSGEEICHEEDQVADLS